MGTLMRLPGTDSVPQTLPLPKHYNQAPTHARAVADAPVAENESVELKNNSARPAIVAGDALGYTGNAPSGDDADTGRVEEALARCARLQTALDELHGELQQHRDVARAEGHEIGLADGRVEAQQEAVTQARSLNALLEQLEQHRADVLSKAEDEIAEAVFAAVGKMLGKKMTTRRGAAAAVRQVCKQITNRHDLVVRVAPAELEFLSADSALFAALGGKARFEADANVELGGCLVESGGGTLDGRLETQLNRLQQVLMRARDKRNGNGDGKGNGKGNGNNTGQPGVTP